MNNSDLIINENPIKEKWDEYVLSHPSGNIFQTSLMFEVYQSTPNCKAGVITLEKNENEIVGLIVYSLIHENGFKRFFSTRAIITGGPLIINDNNEYATILLNAYKKIIQKSNAIYSEIRNIFDVKLLHNSFIKTNFLYEDHLTIHMDLTKTKEELEKALHRGRASNIKRAIKKNVTTKHIYHPEEVTQAYKMIKDTYDRINLPAPALELFLNASKIMNDNIKFYAAFVDGKIIGCRVYLIYKQMMYDWYAAVDREYTSLCPSDILPWNGMLWGKENNIKIYDFAGAGKPNKEYSVREYKLKFGGSLINLGRYQCIHKPLMYRLGIVGIKLYKYI